MKNNKCYIVAFTIFYISGFKTYYRHFDDLKCAVRFCNNPNIKDNCMLYESINYREVQDV